MFSRLKVTNVDYISVINPAFCLFCFDVFLICNKVGHLVGESSNYFDMIRHFLIMTIYD